MTTDDKNQSKTNSLIEIAEQAFQIEVMLVESEGVITDEIASHIAHVDLQLPAKLEAYSRIMERLNFVAQDYDSEIKRLQKIKKGLESTEDFLKMNIRHVMAKLDVKELNGQTCRYILKRIAPKLVFQESLLPDEMKIIIQTTEPDRSKIIDALSAGKTVPGAELHENFALTKLAKK